MRSLQELKLATDNAIGVIEGLRNRPDEVINWADLHCTQAAHVVTDDGDEYYEVSIEEAAPECPQFRQVIALELERTGWPDVHVVTEW